MVRRTTLGGKCQVAGSEIPPVIFFMMEGCLAVKKPLPVAHVVSCLLGVFPQLSPSCQSIAANLTHASVLLSSPTQGRSCALYLMRLV